MSATAAGTPRVRVRARVEGTVQGVGFRPYAYRLARELELGGWVLNDECGVLLEAEGDAAAVERFLGRLRAEAPPLAAVESVRSERIPLTGEHVFAIARSAHGHEPAALVSPDAATCDACLAELFDPADRRYRYPFVNCTNCGPRFTIVRGVPYDRPLTTMAGFEMCARCRAEYDDPADRRFHAEPNACPACGPTARLVAADGRALAHPGRDAPAATAQRLLAGAIVAIKGLGGYHLACLADDEDAVGAVRARKHRYDKPFALMAPNLEAARGLVELAPADERLLESAVRPIVLARRRPDAAVAASVAPRSADLGVMLPYTPLHHLLLTDAGRPLVLTSGNVSDEPIAYDDRDAFERLGAIADAFLVHDRPIHVRADDSVVRSRGCSALVLRRSRGYAPASTPLPVAADRPLLACGAHLKSTFCVAKGRRAWVSHHIGDLENWETLRSFGDAVAHFGRLFAVEPRLVAHDLHPDYLSTRYALECDGLHRLAVQHHHAHLAACLAEHGVTTSAVGAVFDGSGYGSDGTVWGGEILVGDLVGFDRVGHLWPVRLPGGDRAVREPWRMACAWLAESATTAAALAARVSERRWMQVAALAQSELAPQTTSVGRLFDAVAAIAGVRDSVTFEGQAAAELEAVADARESSSYPLTVREDRAGLVLDARETVAAAACDVDAGVDPARVSARFHNALAAATAAACALAAEAHATQTVVLSGGAFQNRRLVDTTERLLHERGLRALVPERLPPNDGGISYGQAAVAAATGGG